jgi:hypothetical protein
MGTGTNGANTAGDFLNGSAWFYIQSPGTSSQHICIQRNNGTYAASSHSFRIKYSTTGFFVSGAAGSTGLTGSITVTPTAISASDEILIIGGGTDAAPTFGALTPTSTVGVRTHIAAHDVAPYGFWMAWHGYGLEPTAGGGYFLNDYMLSGSFPGTDQPVADNSPYTCGLFTTLTQFGDATQQFSMAGAFVKSLSSATNDSLPQLANIRWSALSYNLANTSTVLVPQGVGINPVTQKLDVLPVWFVRRRDPGGNQLTLDQTGLKGASGFMRFPLFNLSNGEVFDYVSTRDKVCFGFLVFDWNGTDLVAL